MEREREFKRKREKIWDRACAIVSDMSFDGRLYDLTEMFRPEFIYLNVEWHSEWEGDYYYILLMKNRMSTDPMGLWHTLWRTMRFHHTSRGGQVRRATHSRRAHLVVPDRAQRGGTVNKRRVTKAVRLVRMVSASSGSG